MFEKPEYVVNWENHPLKPACCHTCASFSNGEVPYCEKWGREYPLPEDFAASETCDDWTDPDGGMPF